MISVVRRALVSAARSRLADRDFAALPASGDLAALDPLSNPRLRGRRHPVSHQSDLLLARAPARRKELATPFFRTAGAFHSDAVTSSLTSPLSLVTGHASPVTLRRRYARMQA